MIRKENKFFNYLSFMYISILEFYIKYALLNGI